MTRIDHFVHGRGRGHASRSLPIAQALSQAGYEVVLHGGGDAAGLLRELPGWVERAPLLPGPLAVPRLAARALRDTGELRRAGTGLVVSDGEQSVFVAARRLGLPSIAVGHDLVYTSCRLPPSVMRWGVWAERVGTALPTLLAGHRVAVHFLPVEPARPNTLVARPDSTSDPSAEIPQAAAHDGHWLAYFRDGNGAKVVEIARALGQKVRWFGPGALDAAGRPVPALPRARFLAELAEATAVMGSAGSNLLAECVAFGKPVLAVHHRREAEQAMNAAWAAAARVAEAVSFEEASPVVVARFRDRVAQGDFARVDLSGLRPVSQVVRELTASLIGPG